jgi:lysyl-tRNA synthetase class 2
VFAGACELANGYVELTDSEEQHRRFTKDQDRRRSSGAVIRTVDDRLLAALEAGLPPCAGVAVGFDRVVALALGVDDIRDVYHFPWS